MRRALILWAILTTMIACNNRQKEGAITRIKVLRDTLFSINLSAINCNVYSSDPVSCGDTIIWVDEEMQTVTFFDLNLIKKVFDLHVPIGLDANEIYEIRNLALKDRDLIIYSDYGYIVFNIDSLMYTGKGLIKKSDYHFSRIICDHNSCAALMCNSSFDHFIIHPIDIDLSSKQLWNDAFIQSGAIEFNVNYGLEPYGTHYLVGGDFGSNSFLIGSYTNQWIYQMDNKTFAKKDSFYLLPFLNTYDDFQLIQGDEVLPKRLTFDSFFFLSKERFVVNHYNVLLVDKVRQTIDYEFMISSIGRFDKSLMIFAIDEPQLIKFISSRNFVIGEDRSNRILYVYSKDSFRRMLEPIN